MAEVKKQQKENRTLYFDYLRLLATFAVMLAHTASSKLYNIDVNSFDWRVLNFYDSICRWSVPAFVMISGALLLNRTVDYNKIYKRYIPRMITAFVFWSIIYYIFAEADILGQITGLVRQGKYERLLYILQGHYHMWYIPMLIGLYICLPVAKQIIDNEKVGKYFLIIAFVFWGVIPFGIRLLTDFCGNEKIKEIVFTINSNIEAMELGFVMGYSFYFILGYYLAKMEFSKKQKIILGIAGIGGFVFTSVMNRIVSVNANQAITVYYNDSYINVMLPAVALFVIFKSIPFKGSKLVSVLSKAGFGAYLAHALAIEMIAYWAKFNTLSFNPVICTPVLAVIVFICAFAVSIVLGKIPVVKDYIV